MRSYVVQASHGRIAHRNEKEMRKNGVLWAVEQKGAMALT